MIDNIHIEYLIDKVVRQPLDVFDLDYSKDQILSDCIELGAYILDHEKPILRRKPYSFSYCHALRNMTIALAFWTWLRPYLWAAGHPR